MSDHPSTASGSQQVGRAEAMILHANTQRATLAGMILSGVAASGELPSEADAEQAVALADRICTLVGLMGDGRA